MLAESRKLAERPAGRGDAGGAAETSLVAAALRAGGAVTHGALAPKLLDGT